MFRIIARDLYEIFHFMQDLMGDIAVIRLIKNDLKSNY